MYCKALFLFFAEIFNMAHTHKKCKCYPAMHHNPLNPTGLNYKCAFSRVELCASTITNTITSFYLTQGLINVETVFAHLSNSHQVSLVHVNFKWVEGNTLQISVQGTPHSCQSLKWRPSWSSMPRQSLPLYQVSTMSGV